MAKKEEVVKAGDEKTAETQKIDDGKSSKETKAFSLPNTKVHVKPVLRAGKWLPDGHSGSFMYDHTVLGLQVPIDKDTGRLKNPLTPEELAYFENDAGLDLEKGALNPYKKKDNFWEDFRVSIRKSDDIITDKTILMTLKLSDPIQYLQYKVLQCNTSPSGGLVAPSWQERLDSGTYRIALVHEGQQNIEKVKRGDMMKQAYKYLSKIDGSSEDMFDFLTIYFLEAAKSKRPSTDWDKDTLFSEIQDLIDTDLGGVIKIIDDVKNYDYKLLVHRGLKVGALVMKGSNKIETVDGIPVGTGLKQAIQWFKDDRHQDEYLTLKNQIELAK
jgi:hypothetical protein